MTSRSVLITGCSSGIGLCSARILKERGYRVFATARQPQDLDSLSNEGLEALYLDLRDSASIKDLANNVLDKTNGKLYALFNNAGYGQPGAVEDLSRDALREQLEVNLLGAHELTSLVVPYMRKAGEGRIVFCSSVLGFVALKFRGAYCASKFALEGLADALRIELRDTGVKVVLLEPGPIETKFRENALQKFKANIRIEGSCHSDSYSELISRVCGNKGAAPFTLPPTAVAKKLLLSLESKSPKPRYYVTVPTYLFGFARRFLSTGLLDFLSLKVGA